MIIALPDATVTILDREAASTYRDWLNGSDSPAEAVDGAPEARLSYIISPPPWSFWVGVGVVERSSLVPVMTFKNTVPVLDLFSEDALIGHTMTLDAVKRRTLDDRLIIHNPGLRGFVQHLREAPIQSLLRRPDVVAPRNR